MQAIFSFLMISIIFIMVPRASVSLQRISEVLDTVPEIKDPDVPDPASPEGSGVIEFDNVTFSYPGADNPVLSCVSFTASPGETTAIVGSTGSGKSTLINLIPRFYDVSGGEVRIDGIDVRKMDLETLYAKIGLVPQRGVLFSGTIKSNVMYGAPNALPEQMTEAIRVAQAEEFVKELDGKADAPIAQGGANVSGGQKQRIAIARAVIRNPEIYIFDDSFSALDFKTDALLRAALKEKTRHKTVLIVAQRISTIMDADNIIVLNDGQVVGTGTHQKLLATCPVYKEIASSQLSDAELAAVLPAPKSTQAPGLEAA
jgi:ATP-binding cassette, subfamily B, multidrug efflux pump